MLKHRRKQSLCHGRISVFVGMRETVATRRCRSPNARQPADVMVQGIAHVVESDRWVSWAYSIATTWLHGVNVRALGSTPQSWANLATRWPGMKLQSCARTLSFPLVGVGLLTCFFFTPDRYATRRNQANSNRFS